MTFVILLVAIFFSGSSLGGCVNHLENGSTLMTSKWDPLDHKERFVQEAYLFDDHNKSKISIGMTKTQVETAWGKPALVQKGNRIDNIGIKIGADEFWTFPSGNKSSEERIYGQTLYFKGDMLIKILEGSLQIK